MPLHPLVAIGIAFVISSIMSVGGLTGAFLLVPLQISVLGIVGPTVTPTNHLFNVVAIPSGVYGYWREGRMLWPLAAVIAVGTLPGVVLGSCLRIFLFDDPRIFKLFVGCVLIFIGSRLVQKIVRPRQQAATAAAGVSEIQTKRFDWHHLDYTFDGNSHGVSVPHLVAVTVGVGVVGGIYGIGGGAMIAPILVSVWHLPIYTIAGATLFGTFLTSVTGVTCFWLISTFGGAAHVEPNWLLGLSFGIGGLLGTYTGARLQRFVAPRLIEILLAVVITGLGLTYVIAFFAKLGRT